MARILNIMRFSVHDGPGIRTTVFLQGCPLRCAWCHNPESQAFGAQQMVFTERCRRCGACAEVCPHHAIHAGEPPRIPAQCEACGRCAEACLAGAREIVGREMTAAEVVSAVERDHIFFDDSSGGVTISGGEPLAQPHFTAELLTLLQARDIHTVLDTCGYAAPATFDRVAALASEVLFDIKVLDAPRHEFYTGVTNTLIVANLRRLAASGAAVTIRYPLIPGVNDSPEDLDALARLAAECSISRVDVLPYHSIGSDKRRRLGARSAARTFPVPGVEQSEAAAARLRYNGIQVHVGGLD